VRLTPPTLPEVAPLLPSTTIRLVWPGYTRTVAALVTSPLASSLYQDLPLLTPLNTPPARSVSKLLPASEIVAYDWTGGLKLHQMVRPRQGALYWLHNEYSPLSCKA
jgi:hypothetical protein